MVAFQFPPFSGSSGVQRTLRFVQHLPDHGWEAIVLSARPSAFEATSSDLLGAIPNSTIVQRSFALDAARHFAIWGRYPASFARPDRWRSWGWWGIRSGMDVIRKYRPDAIWSTFPIPTAHVIGCHLQNISRLPYLADFRDPMAQEDYPRDRRTWLSYSMIERETLKRARFSIFTTPGAAEMYAERYPEVEADRIRVIENGYDEESFEPTESGLREEPLNEGAFTFLHSGALYPSERDPTQLFVALGNLKKRGWSASKLRLRFRASGQDELLRRLAMANDVEEVLDLVPSIPYKAALAEMLRADCLLLLQAANCNQQIPAKVYEYLRAGQPILALTDSDGDTAAVLRRTGVTSIAQLDSAPAIERAVIEMMAALEEGSAGKPDPMLARRNSRAARAAELADLLDSACASR